MKKRSFWTAIGLVLVVGFLLGFAFGPQNELMGQASTPSQPAAASQAATAAPATAEACLQLHDTAAMREMHASMGPQAAEDCEKLHEQMAGAMTQMMGGQAGMMGDSMHSAMMDSSMHTRITGESMHAGMMGGSSR